jgi:hypothetical protein
VLDSGEDAGCSEKNSRRESNDQLEGAIAGSK